MKANLSRIHSLLGQTAQDIRRLLDETQKPLAANGADYCLEILESTTNADLDVFVKRLGDKRKKIYEIFEECSNLLEYSFYLRKELDKANRASGVADKLLQQNNIRKKTQYLYKIRDIISLSLSSGLDELKNADYYKASYTEKQKIYQLPLRVFSAADYRKIQQEINECEKAAFKTGNEVAYLNQTTVVEILSLEEFVKHC